MSFTTGGLFYGESVMLAKLYLQHGDWKIVRQKVMVGNLLQARTRSTSNRVVNEVISRLKTLNTEELKLFVEVSYQEQRQILWFAVCRRYRFISEFAVEVIRERFITLKTELNHEDFDAFFNRKSEWHEELDQLQPTTRTKLRQVLFKILREVNFLSVDNTINRVILSPVLLHFIRNGSQQDALCFPSFESTLNLNISDLNKSNSNSSRERAL